MDLSKLIIFCKDPRCGEPIPRTGSYKKRRMIYAGRQFSTSVYMCPYCGRKRYFKERFFFSEMQETKGDCFIACTVYESDDAPQVRALRKFRDEYLIGNSLGSVFVKGYYQLWGPTAARLVDWTGPRGRKAVRRLLDWFVEVFGK